MNRTTSRLIRIALCGLFLISFANVANAQFKAGVQGTVTDSSGGLVPDTKITLTNAETGKSQEVMTSAEGSYRISGLAPGLYRLTAEKQGYKKTVLEKVAGCADVFAYFKHEETGVGPKFAATFLKEVSR